MARVAPAPILRFAVLSSLSFGCPVGGGEQIAVHATDSESGGSTAGSAASSGQAASDSGIPEQSSSGADSAGETGMDSSGSVIDGMETGASTRTYRAEVWADNWSSMYVDETLVMEDSEPITQERSFNAETFAFEAAPPFGLNVVLKDFIENDSGLEYIGEPNQQMGDGGYILQLTDMESGERVAFSNANWRCLTVHEAPLDKSCENAVDPLTECEWSIQDEPAGWKGAEFDDSAWVAPSIYTAAEVDPKDGYDDIGWDVQAQFIWGADLETHNTILCRMTVGG